MQASDAIHALALQILSVTIAPTVVWPDYDRSLYGAMLRVLQTGLAIDANGVISTVTPWSIPLAGASTPGSVVFVGSSGLPAQDNANFFWDDTKKVFTVTDGALLNCAIGDTAFQNNIDGYENVALGAAALQANTHGYRNMAVGLSALLSNTTGYHNVAIGRTALLSNTIGFGNIALGRASLYTCDAGIGNVAIGDIALLSLVSGQSNVAIGNVALLSCDGSFNMAIGTSALYASLGDRNVAVGSNGYLNLVTGDRNVAIGDAVGLTLTAGSRNVLIGQLTDVPAASTSDYLNIGDLIKGVLAGTKLLTVDSAQLVGTTTTFTNGAAAQVGTLLNAPAAGNPTKWIPIDDNGTTRYMPAW